MKIALYHELHKGGARRAVWEIGKWLSNKNSVDLYISGDKALKEEKESFDKVFSYPFEEKKWNRRDWSARIYKDSVEYFKLLRHNSKIGKEINQKNYDTVFVHPSKFTQAPFVLLFLKGKKIYYCQEPLRTSYDSALKDISHIKGAKKYYELLSRFVRKIIDKVNISRTYFIFANSNFSKNSIKKAYGINSEVMYLGVDHNFFRPSKIKKDIDILYIGTKERIDNYQMFVGAVSNFRGKLNIYEHIIGSKWLSDHDLRKLYQRSKLVITLHRNEPFGLIPIEAGACGSVVVAFNKGGYRESIVNEKTGFLINNSTELTMVIKKILFDKTSLEKMSREARRHILAKWTWEINVAKMEKFMTKNYES